MTHAPSRTVAAAAGAAAAGAAAGAVRCAGAGWCLPSHSPLTAGAPRLTPASETAAGARRGAGWRLPSPPSPLPAGAPRLTPVAPWDAAALLLWLREMRPLRLAFSSRAAALAELWQGGALRSKLSPSRGDTWRLPSPSSPPAGAPRMTPAAGATAGGAAGATPSACFAAGSSSSSASPSKKRHPRAVTRSALSSARCCSPRVFGSITSTAVLPNVTRRAADAAPLQRLLLPLLRLLLRLRLLLLLLRLLLRLLLSAGGASTPGRASGGWSEAGGCGAAPPNSCAATAGSGTRLSSAAVAPLRSHIAQPNHVRIAARVWPPGAW